MDDYLKVPNHRVIEFINLSSIVVSVVVIETMFLNTKQKNKSAEQNEDRAQNELDH